MSIDLQSTVWRGFLAESFGSKTLSSDLSDVSVCRLRCLSWADLVSSDSMPGRSWPGVVSFSLRWISMKRKSNTVPERSVSIRCDIIGIEYPLWSALSLVRLILLVVFWSNPEIQTRHELKITRRSFVESSFNEKSTRDHVLTWMTEKFSKKVRFGFWLYEVFFLFFEKVMNFDEKARKKWKLNLKEQSKIDKKKAK